MITVYTKPGCPSCVGTMRYLERHGLNYATVDITVDPGARQYVIDLGYTSLPVVVAGAECWSGLRIDRLAALKPVTTVSDSGVIGP
jgi:glutaredoxin-like protein NrdH